MDSDGSADDADTETDPGSAAASDEPEDDPVPAGPDRGTTR